MAAPIHLELTITIQPDQTWHYISTPFEVPNNVTRIAVSYRYDNQTHSDPEFTGGNTIDIGIFDARGAQWMSPGFRGWSGSARQSFYLARDSATSGYMPGPLQAGTWYVCLGAYKIAEAGCRCQIEIDMAVGEGSETQVSD